jgi:hypothetical protein
MRATNIKATRGAVATIHSGSDRRKKSKTIESTLDQVPGDFHSKYTARARTLVTKMMFWALAGVTFSAAKIVSCNKNKKIHGLPSTLLQLFYFSQSPSPTKWPGLLEQDTECHATFLVLKLAILPALWILMWLYFCNRALTTILGRRSVIKAT